MAYQPLTQQQYQSARNAGFSPEKIIEMERVRKEREGVATSTQPKLGGILGVGKGVVDFVNQNIARPFVDIAAMPVQGLAKALGQSDPYAGGALGGIDVAQIDKPLRKLGSAGEIGSYAIPFGTVAKGVSTAAKPLIGQTAGKIVGNIGSGALGGYGIDVASGLARGETSEALKPGLGTALGVALPLVPPALSGAKKLGMEALGVTTGTGAGVTDKMFEAARQGGSVAKEATDALRGRISPEQIVDDARSALGQIVQQRTQTYQDDLARVAGNKKAYDITPIINSLNENLKKFRIKVGKEGLDFSQSAIRFDRKAQQEVQTIFDEMKKFGSQKGDRTAVGIDSLKRALGDLYSDSSNVRALTQAVKKSTRDVLKAVPEYDKMTKAYEDSTNLIKEIQRGLSLGDRAQTDTAFRKLTTALRTNNEFRKQLIKELDAVSGKDLSTQIAGQQMSEILPRGLMRQIGTAGAIGGAATGFAVPLLKAALFFSPRVVGEILTVLGYSAGKIDRLMKVIAPQGLRFPGDVLLQQISKIPPKL